MELNSPVVDGFTFFGEVPGLIRPLRPAWVLDTEARRGLAQRVFEVPRVSIPSKCTPWDKPGWLMVASLEDTGL